MVFSDTFFFVTAEAVFTVQVRLEIQWEQHAEIGSSVPNPSGGHFQLRDTSPISFFLVYFGDQINSCYPEERAYWLWKQKWSPRGPSQSKPSLLQTEIWNVIWKLSLPSRLKAYISWKEILFSLQKQVIDGSTFTQMCLFNEILTHSKVYFPLSAKHSSSRAEPRHSELSCKQLWLCQGAYINEILVKLRSFLYLTKLFCLFPHYLRISEHCCSFLSCKIAISGN